MADQLFATLDPTSRRLNFADGHHLILTDTVGFIRDLPGDLVAAFRATLEELEGAAILMHVVDVADPRRDEKDCCRPCDIGRTSSGTNQRSFVLNKCDTIDAFEYRALARKLNAISVSALDGLGLENLREELAKRTSPQKDPSWNQEESQEDVRNSSRQHCPQ